MSTTTTITFESYVRWARSIQESKACRVSSTILRFVSYQKTQRIKSYVQKTKYNGTVHTIIENSGTNHFLTGTPFHGCSHRLLRWNWELDNWQSVNVFMCSFFILIRLTVLLTTISLPI
jgi:hypothetical protein